MQYANTHYYYVVYYFNHEESRNRRLCTTLKIFKKKKKNPYSIRTLTLKHHVPTVHTILFTTLSQETVYLYLLPVCTT